MFRGDRDIDTICALSTPKGVGGIAVIRVSGGKAFDSVRKLCLFLPHNPEQHRIYFGTLKSLELKEPIDEVLVSTFVKGHSFTGEEVAEISCHGSPTVADLILEQLVLCGCRSAERGEFTYRAFMNGKLDLVQAESVASLIESQSRRASRQALDQLKGGLSKRLEKIENELTWCLAHLEAGIDFATEGIEVISSPALDEKLNFIEKEISEIIDGYKSGRIISEGIKVVLSGIPNVGKSSLLNLLCGESKAIVTEVAGTTRDVVESVISINGIRVLLQDTAGLRESQDVVEKIGIEKSKQSQVNADINLFVFDASAGLGAEEIQVLRELDLRNTAVVGNKCDKLTSSIEAVKQSVKSVLQEGIFFNKTHNFQDFMDKRVLFVSSLNDKDKLRIESLINEISGASEIQDEGLIFKARHFENLMRVKENLMRAHLLVKQSASAEFVALELKEALIDIQEILGKRFDDQIMDRVFKEFCIGK